MTQESQELGKEEMQQRIQELEQQIDERKNKDKHNFMPTKIKPVPIIVNLFSKTNQKILNSNGFLTKKGQYLCKAEWHATMLGTCPIATGFLLPTPMGELFILAELGMLRTGFKKKMESDKVTGHLGDVIEEIGYTFAASFVTTAIFLYFEIGEVVSIDVSSLVIAMLGGA